MPFPWLRMASPSGSQNQAFDCDRPLPNCPGMWLPYPDYVVFKKYTDIRSPAMTYCLLDEHPDSINAGGYANQMVENAAQARIIDFPGSYHNGASGLNFADGHAEIKKWLDHRTKPPVKYNNQLILNQLSANNKDVIWLAERTTVRAD